ncbi:TlpA family protein disulfide reductase, partial [Bacillus sp. CRN 9]|nr:TlpA family protein disulfide reductase [Bacillus sp. CRN 9]
MLKKIMIIFLFIVVTLPLSYNVHAEEDRLPGLKIGTEAPDFSLKDLSGQSISLSDYRGKKVILNFWATWCPPCKVEMKDFQTFHLQKKDQDIVILAVNIDPKSNVKGYIKKMGISFQVVLDEGDEVNEQYEVFAVPTTYFINENGIIKDKYF